jgi:release factor glutamine methyltransferase
MTTTATTKRTWTILELINWSKDYLAEKGFENARLETELLLGHVLSLPRIELYLQYERQLSEHDLAGYKTLLKRRLTGEPVQYVTGTAGFMLADFEVTPDVLIPRPETEALVEVAARLLAEPLGRAAADVPILADIGTGSGVIAVTLAQKFPNARVVATDVSPEALAVAARNAERTGVAGRVTFVEGTGLAPLFELGLGGSVSGLVSNPPYVRSCDMDGLPVEVRDFEPRLALDGGSDGLDCLRSIVKDVPMALVDGGIVAFEFGDGQAHDVRSLLEPLMDSVVVHRDYAGRDRIATARAHSNGA